MWEFLKDFKFEVSSISGIILLLPQKEIGFEIQLFYLDQTVPLKEYYALDLLWYIVRTKLGS
jgi:hypothetical protein